jgi:RNA polymerase sigma-70 factor (ECF subfamily)
MDEARELEAGVEAGGGPAAAPGELDLRELRGRLVEAVGRVCPPWLAAQREDIVQTALVRVTRLLGAREERRELAATYLWKAAYSCTMDEIRKLRRRRETPLDPDLEPAAMPRPVDPEQAARAREAGRAVGRCLERLVRPRRLGVVLYLQGHSLPESAQLLGWSAKRTENLVYRGLADLRRCLDEKGFAP